MFTYQYDGTDWLENAALQAPTPQAEAKFGRSLSVDGNWLAVGAYQSDSGATDSGSVNIFEWTGSAWTHRQTLTAPTPSERAYFGQSVLISGDLLAVGAPGTGQSSGTVYVYRRSGSTYAWEATLTPSTGSGGDASGYSLAWSGSQLFIGAPLATVDGNLFVGAVYAFSESASVWSEDQQINNPRPMKYDMFGSALSVHDDALVVGAMGSDEAGTNAGSVYLYHENGGSGLWEGIQRLLPIDRESEARFGASLLSLNESLVVGAPGSQALGQSGTVHFFRAGPTAGLLRPSSTLTPSDAASNQRYGYSLAVSDDYFAVGAPGDASGQGAVYVYPRPELTITDDTDGNGTIDDLEDSDGDGIGNLAEVQNGASPWMPDSDLDGLIDSVDPDTATPSNALGTGLVVFTPLSQ